MIKIKPEIIEDDKNISLKVTATYGDRVVIEIYNLIKKKTFISGGFKQFLMFNELEKRLSEIKEKLGVSDDIPILIL